MASSRLAIALPDYERIFRVIYSVINEHANAPHACIFFASVGAAILELKYKIKARPVAGAAAFGVDSKSAMVSTFGQVVGDELVSNETAFHCWVQAGDIVIDFMAPLFKESLRSYGHDVDVPRRMFQKPIAEMASSVHELHREGSFFLCPNLQLTMDLLQSFAAKPTNGDLANVCLAWYTKPPKKLAADMGMRDDEGRTYFLKPTGPIVSGVW